MSSKFPKKDVPQPKYKLGEVLVFKRAEEKGVGVIEEIVISICKSGNAVMYRLSSHEHVVLESDVTQRIVV